MQLWNPPSNPPGSLSPNNQPASVEIIQASVRREKDPKVCVPKMARSEFPDGKFRFFPTMVTLVWGGGGSRGGGAPMVVGRSKVRLRSSFKLRRQWVDCKQGTAGRSRWGPTWQELEKGASGGHLRCAPQTVHRTQRSSRTNVSWPFAQKTAALHAPGVSSPGPFRPLDGHAGRTPSATCPRYAPGSTGDSSRRRAAVPAGPPAANTSTSTKPKRKGRAVQRRRPLRKWKCCGPRSR